MSECIGNVFILNGELQPTEIFNNSLVYEGDSIYEVLKIVGGRPVFFLDHLERLKKSVSIQKKTLLASVEDLKRDIISLIKSEKQKDINLKIVFNYYKRENYLIYLIKSIYPTPDQYKKGVKGTLFFAERKDPESKVINHKLRSEIYNKLMIDGAYEAILVNTESNITEGSRSNIFLIKGERLFTSPDDAVLNGITRKQIISICRVNGITLEFISLKADKINEFDSIFMTGTSPGLLPFYCIDNNFFKVDHHLINTIRTIYLAMAKESLAQFSNMI
jgi:branched-chain amino acid aminotransferase